MNRSLARLQASYIFGIKTHREVSDGSFHIYYYSSAERSQPCVLFQTLPVLHALTGMLTPVNATAKERQLSVCTCHGSSTVTTLSLPAVATLVVAICQNRKRQHGLFLCGSRTTSEVNVVKLMTSSVLKGVG